MGGLKSASTAHGLCIDTRIVTVSTPLNPTTEVLSNAWHGRCGVVRTLSACRVVWHPCRGEQSEGRTEQKGHGGYVTWSTWRRYKGILPSLLLPPRSFSLLCLVHTPVASSSSHSSLCKHTRNNLWGVTLGSSALLDSIVPLQSIYPF